MKETNNCDKCNEETSTYELIWITSEDFEPRKGEVVPKALYDCFDALCDSCYKEGVEQ